MPYPWNHGDILTNTDLNAAFANLSGMLPLTGGTLTGPLIGTTLSLSGILTSGGSSNGQIIVTPGANTATAPVISTNSSAGIQINGGAAGTSLVGGGPLVTNNGITITRGLAPAAAALNPAVNWAYTLSGSTTTINPALMAFNTFGGDSVAIASPASSTLSMMNFQQAFGSTGMTGNRCTMNLKATQTAQSGNLASGVVPNGPFYQAANIAFQANATEGGTSTGQLGSYGQIFAGGSIIRSLGAATNYHEVCNWEFDLNLAASCYKKFGIKVTQLASDVAQGVLDGAYVIENGGSATINGWKTGFLAVQPNANFPYDPAGRLFAAPLSSDYLTVANTMALGFDIQETLFTGYAYRSRGMGIDGAGSVHVGNAYLVASGTGASLDLSGSVGPAEGATITGGAVVSGGTSGRFANTVMYDSYGGVYKIAAVTAGVVTQLTVLRTPYFASATPPANPISLTDAPAQAGNTVGTVTVNLTWTQPNALAVQPTAGGKIGFYGHTPVVQAATPTTLADVIAVLRGCGLAA